MNQEAVFRTTQWTRVLEARESSVEGQAALSELCKAYYEPVLAFIRVVVFDKSSAPDLAQEFFVRFLEGKILGSVQQGRGRFRSYLLGAVKHFLADRRDFDGRLKRGGQHEHIPFIESTDTSHGLQFPDSANTQPDAEFDRRWAMTVIQRALSALGQEHRVAGKGVQFELLKPWLTGDSDEHSQSESAQQLAMSEGAVKVAIHRLRVRFRELMKLEIGQTLNDPGLIADELACLRAALSQR